jgi:hypothetical protein
MPGRIAEDHGVAKRSRKLPKDMNLLGKAIVDLATANAPAESDPDAGKNPAPVALGRLRAKKGGPARAKKLGKKKLTEAARKAAQARWANR